MARDLIGRYVWIVDTLTRYERLSRSDLNRLWMRSDISGGEPLPERVLCGGDGDRGSRIIFFMLCQKKAAGQNKGAAG